MTVNKLEKYVQRDIIKFVIKSGGDCVKIVAPSRRGLPDLLCMLNGVVFLCETKRLGKDLSGLQEYFFLIWNGVKTNCIKADSLEMFKENIKKVGIDL